ncbi:hypothetical protein [Kribbella deserti]|uniref:Peptidoglycan-binding protein n=1 Tax=Kribbella deserti TaxID=1926257 RepID=A0ABV6QI19_9ACTN
MPEIRTTWRGKRLNQRTVAMIKAAERLTKFELDLMQGSYNRGGVSASAGTHDGGGAIDVRAAGLTPKQRRDVVLALRKVGFAAWLRTPAQGDWPWHIHAIAVGDKDLSRGAAQQVREYRRGLNGLANRGPDDGPPGYYRMTWEHYQRLLAANVPPRPILRPTVNTTISLSALRIAAQRDAMSGAWAADRAQVLAWAADPKVGAIARTEIRPPSGTPWHQHFRQMTRKIQTRFGLPANGTFGPETAAVMERFGYTITN